MAAVADLVVRITSDVKDAVAGVGQVEGRTSKMTAGIKSAALPAAAALAAIGAAAVSAGNAAAEDAQSQAVLSTALKNTTGASDAAVASVEAHLAAMSKATGVADDELRPAMGALVRATGDVSTAQSALGQALDISAATGKSVESVSAALAKAYGGQTTSLGRLVPGMDAAVLASGDMNAIMAELAATTGGSAAAAADTAAGKMKIMQTQMGEAQEEIGTALLPTMAALATALATGAVWAQKHSTTVKVVVAVVAALAAAILVANAALKVNAIVTGVAEAVSASYTKKGIAFKVAELARAAATGIATAATTVATVAVRALGIAIAFATGPVGLIVAAIALFVAGLILLYKKNDAFASFVDGAWAKVSGAVTGAINTVLGLMRALPGQVQSAFSSAGSWLVNAGRAIIEGLGAGIEAAKAWLMGKVNAIADSIPGWLKKRLGIASPSKVTALIGHQVMQGLSAGMDDGLAGVKAISEKVAATVSETMAKRFKSDKRAAKAARQVMAAIEDETAALEKNARKRQQVYDDLAAARDALAKVQDERKNYAEGITNAAAAFGAITNLSDKEATSAEAILADMRQRVKAAMEFQHILGGLTAAGLDTAVIRDLAAAGVEGGLAIAQGLAEGGPAAIAEANALQAQLTTTATALGTDTATTMYAAGEQSAQALVDGLVLNQEALEQRAEELAEALAKAIRKALRKALKKGTSVGTGNGAGTLTLVPAMAASSTAPAVPMATGRAASTAAAPGPTIVVNGAIDPEATARQIRRVLDGHDRRMGLAG